MFNTWIDLVGCERANFWELGPDSSAQWEERPDKPSVKDMDDYNHMMAQAGEYEPITFLEFLRVVNETDRQYECYCKQRRR